MQLKFFVITALCGLFMQAASANEQLCEQARKWPMPEEDMPSPQTIQQLKDCDANGWYYGIGSAIDYEKARACAYKVLAENPYGYESGVLMMVYANGYGVKRNYDLAIKFSCAFSGSEPEIEGRFGHIAKMRKMPNPEPLDICDYVTSGSMMGYCASIQEDIASHKINAELDALAEKWSDTASDSDVASDAVQAAFSELRSAETEYAYQSSENEIDLSGTARGEFQSEERARLLNEFTQALKQFESGHLPTQDEKQFAVLDNKLNAAYKKIMATKNGYVGTTITPKGIKETQKTWLKYRDVWAKFGVAKYPSTTAVAWQAYWTEKRLPIIEGFAN